MMAESDEEIEYLEEDAEIVQKCVQSTLPTARLSSPVPRKGPQSKIKPQMSLLVERPTVQKRKKKEEEDSEYAPSDDDLPPSPPSPITIRKKRTIKPTKKFVQADNNDNSNKVLNFKSKMDVKNSNNSSSTALFLRKKYNIRIPDYDDPLCLPVRAIKNDASDIKRLKNWNNVCLEHFKHCDTLLKPERGNTKRSTRTAVFRNIVNKQTGNTETTIWSKTCVENEDSDKKSEIFQCILPRYKERKGLDIYVLAKQKYHSTTKTIDEAILSKEMHKEGEALVIYKPKEALSAVYGMIEKQDTEDQEPPEQQPKTFLKELTACKVCAPCYQSSWRAIIKQKRKSVICPICARSSVTVYNLLSHIKTHSANDVRRYKKIISTILADIVGYHYKCRICRVQFDGIKELRSHINEHQCKDTFTCQVCNRVVN